MPMPKCRICKKSIKKNNAYCIQHEVHKRDGTISHTPYYYCSENEYVNYLRKKTEQEQARADVWNFIRIFFGDSQNTALFREEKLWGDPIKVSEFIKNNKYKFNIINNKTFDSEYGKIMYFSAIIKNNINDFLNKPQEQQIESESVSVEMYENKHKNKTRRKGLMEDE